MGNEGNSMASEQKLKKVFRINMLIGLLVVAVSVFFILNGHYDNLQQRLSAEAWMNGLAVGGILYMVSFWYMCVFRKYLFSKVNAK